MENVMTTTSPEENKTRVPTLPTEAEPSVIEPSTVLQIVLTGMATTVALGAIALVVAFAV
jgi:hypothetical protein